MNGLVAMILELEQSAQINSEAGDSYWGVDRFEFESIDVQKTVHFVRAAFFTLFDGFARADTGSPALPAFPCSNHNNAST